MAQVKCSKGHYYDNSLFEECPTCKEESPNTVLMDIGGVNKRVKDEIIADKKEASSPPKIRKKEKQPISNDNSNVVNESEKTQYIRNSKTITEEANQQQQAEVVLAGWIVIVSEGLNKGKYYPISFGFNKIGREESNDIVIKGDNSISREKHSIIIYDYSNNNFFLKHEDGKYLTYLNGDVVLETKKLEPFDKIKIGNTEFIFIPLCGDKFQWSDIK